MAEIISGSYHEVELADGRKGNYEVTRQYYRDFELLSRQQPRGFNELCAHILHNPKAPLKREHRNILVGIGMAWRLKEHPEALLIKPEEEIKDFVCLSVKQGVINRIFTTLAGAKPVCRLVSPFMMPGQNADTVRAHNLTLVKIPDWAGTDVRQFPALRLHKPL